MRFLYPADVLRPRRPDEMYADEIAAIRSVGFEASVVSIESLLSAGNQALPGSFAGEQVVYRGWMLTAEEYDALHGLICAQGGVPLTSPEQYLLGHHLPNWYPYIQELTPETVVLPVDVDLDAELRTLAWGRYFIKDYVKSLKTAAGSVVDRPEDVGALVEGMRAFRGRIEGGFCVRRFEAFVPDTERRFFVIGGQPYVAEPNADVPGIVQSCASRIHSPFFSVDVVQRVDGIERVVEVGDGQVSDTVGWQPERFAQVWRERVDAWCLSGVSP